MVAFKRCLPHKCLQLLTSAGVGPQYAVIIGDLTYADDYTADGLPNRFYTGAQFGQVIQPTLNPIATSLQPRVGACAIQRAACQPVCVTECLTSFPVRSGIPGAA